CVISATATEHIPYCFVCSSTRSSALQRSCYPHAFSTGRGIGTDGSISADFVSGSPKPLGRAVMLDPRYEGSKDGAVFRRLHSSISFYYPRTTKWSDVDSPWMGGGGPFQDTEFEGDVLRLAGLRE